MNKGMTIKEDTIKLNMAGLKKKEIDITVKDRYLVVTGSNEEYEYEYVISGITHYDTGKTKATLENGILRLDLELKQDKKPKKISID